MKILVQVQKKISGICGIFEINLFYFQDLNVPIVDKETKSDRISLLVDYFSTQKNNHRVKTIIVHLMSLFSSKILLL